MSEIRMSLKEAGERLGIKPNSVRSRFKKGSLRGERDNSGKLWVFIDLTKTASDLRSKSLPSKPSIEAFEGNEIKALKGHLKVTTEQLSKAEAEIADLKPQAVEAVRLKAENDGLKELQGRGDAEIERLRSAYADMDAERQELIKAVLQRKKGIWERVFG